MLGRLALLNPDKIGLTSFGSRAPFFPRQLRFLAQLSRDQASTVDKVANQRIGDLPFLEESLSWFEHHLPDERKANVRIVHGDYKIDNLIFHPTEPRVIGILDWELSTLGDPVRKMLQSLISPVLKRSSFHADSVVRSGQSCPSF